MIIYLVTEHPIKGIEDWQVVAEGQDQDEAEAMLPDFVDENGEGVFAIGPADEIDMRTSREDPVKLWKWMGEIPSTPEPAAS